MEPRLEILPAPVGVEVRRPCHRQRVHAIFVFQNVRCIETVFAAAPRHDAVVLAVVFPKPVAEAHEFALALFPVDGCLFGFGNTAGCAYSFRIETDSRLLGIFGMRKLNRRIWTLVGCYATFAEYDFLGKAVFSRYLFLWSDHGMIEQNSL